MSYRSEMIQVAAVALAAIQDLDNEITSTSMSEMSHLTNEIITERLRQENKWGRQHHTPEKWLVILMEEVGEAAKDVLEYNFDPTKL